MGGVGRVGCGQAQARAWREQVAGLFSLDRITSPNRRRPCAPSCGPTSARASTWLCFLWRHQLGGILADDMGLGKTLQSLAMIFSPSSRARGRPVPHRRPDHVVANWAAEAARFTPDLRVVAITDTLRRRGQDLVDVIAGADVIVTSYTLFRLDADAYASVRGRA